MSLEDTITMNVAELKKLLDEGDDIRREMADFIERYSNRDNSNLSRPEARGRMYMDD